MMEGTPYFKYKFRMAAQLDIGKVRSSNQDQTVLCKDYGFFAVCDGMGGFPAGGKTSAMLAAVLPQTMALITEKYTKKPSPKYAGSLLKEQIQTISDNIYLSGNQGGSFNFGSTICGVWLVGKYAVFINLGDSRGYLLPFYKRRLQRITKDHNLAEVLVDQGVITAREAKNHPSSSRLTRFVGMQTPASADVFLVKVRTGDRILLCSDGLYGMISSGVLQSLLRSSKSPKNICNLLIDAANSAGGKDNLSAIYIQIARQHSENL
jgi:PPM family protein phosphatase